MTPTHDELRDLVAAYALDAIDADDTQAVEDHIRDCPRCRFDLRDFREIAAKLDYSGQEAPAGVWERIVAAGSQPPAAPPALQVIVSGGDEGPGILRRLAPPLAAGVAAAAVAVLAVSVAHDGSRIDQLSSAVAQARGTDQALALAMDPGARRITLTSRSGDAAAVLAVRADGKAVLVPFALPALPDTETYQVWTIAGDQARSAGLLLANTAGLQFSVPFGAGTVAVTIEPSGGSRRPSSSPVASAPV